MIVFVANSRKATVKSDEPITAGSKGIPVSFVLSEHFDLLENVAVFQGCGKTVILVLTCQDTYIPPEVVATDGGSLRIGVYGRNADGTIAVPTVWGSPLTIVPGSIPSGLNPEQPTPDWTAQVQEQAGEALQTANEALERSAPPITQSDEGKVLTVANQAPAWNKKDYIIKVNHWNINPHRNSSSLDPDRPTDITADNPGFNFDDVVEVIKNGGAIKLIYHDPETYLISGWHMLYCTLVDDVHHSIYFISDTGIDPPFRAVVVEENQGLFAYGEYVDLFSNTLTLGETTITEEQLIDLLHMLI